MARPACLQPGPCLPRLLLGGWVAAARLVLAACARSLCPLSLGAYALVSIPLRMALLLRRLGSRPLATSPSAQPNRAMTAK